MVLHLTRKGDDSNFGQDVYYKLTNAKGFEKRDSDDQTSEWSSLFNLNNPNSSFAKSIAASKMVVCTDWDHNMGDDAIKEAYHAPLYGLDKAVFENSLPEGQKLNFVTGTKKGCTIP